MFPDRPALAGWVRSCGVPVNGSVIYIIDAEPSGEALRDLLSSRGHQTVLFRSPLEFLASDDPDRCGCVLLDVGLPGISGIQLQAILNQMGSQRPLIFLSAVAPIEMVVEALRAGALNFLVKPTETDELLRTVDEALALDAQRRRAARMREGARSRASSLTAREWQVFRQVLLGRLNKQIAVELGTVEKTVKVHRARVMRKMGVRSLPELVNLAEVLDCLQPSGDRRERSPLEGFPSSVASWVWDIPSDRVFADPTLARLFGVSRGSAQGRPLDEYLRAIHPEDVLKVSNLIRRARISGRDFVATYRVTRPDGESSLLLARGRVTYDRHGDPAQFPGVAIDITPWALGQGPSG
jgi:PAS domain S-box-containing protein